MVILPSKLSVGCFLSFGVLCGLGSSFLKFFMGIPGVFFPFVEELSSIINLLSFLHLSWLACFCSSLLLFPSYLLCLFCFSFFLYSFLLSFSYVFLLLGLVFGCLFTCFCCCCVHSFFHRICCSCFFFGFYLLIYYSYSFFG